MKAALLIMTALGFASGVASQAPTVECPVAAADTTGWVEYDEGAFTVRLPPRFVSGGTGGIDSQVGVWRAGEAVVSYDFGYYSNDLQRDEHNPFPQMAVCQESGEGRPRIIAYRTEEGMARLAAHWPGLSRDGFGEITLTLGGSHRSTRDLSEVLAIVQSVRFKPAPR